ncbi:LacI family DNA-binding transcriptional regulator [Pseudonocardia sp. MH-G8]|uniref:LacI family DNA-binding transcriptional regulator n=1 Tax=Pseudonocardia sp. MH-G8 TaxID=1854588 RepID=UPI000B9FE990|nr:LacI family DNA-binding transcriptional regulator [Pseudonocardia sp. MH-G8]OZM83274.1 LacI family transcriptional regulator [Pseudonocardia sp. MH-G8]
MARRPSVTSTQIAREARVAQSTVSRVLNGGSVSPQTRERVLAVLEKYDFQPSQAARSLVGSRTGVVGVVIRDLTNPFYPVMVKAMEQVLYERGLRLFLVTDVVAPEEGVAMLRREGVEGAIFTAAVASDPLPGRLTEHGIPVVLCHRTIDGFPADQVEADNVEAGRLAAEHLLGLGHRRLAMVAGVAGASTAVQRGDGFRARVREFDPALPVVQVEGGFDYDVSYAAARALLAGPDRPTALFCQNDVMAYAVLNAASACGIDVPGALSVVGCDDVPMSGWERIALTTVRQPLVRIAQVGAQLLLDRLAAADAPLQREVLPVGFVTRGTTAPPA